MPALTELYGDPGLGFLAGILGTTGNMVDNITNKKAPKATKKNKKKQAADKRKEAELIAAIQAAEATAPAAAMPTVPMPPSIGMRPMSMLEVPKPMAVYPQISSAQKQPDIAATPSGKMTPRPTPDFKTLLMESMRNRTQNPMTMPQSMRPGFEPMANMPKAAHGGVPHAQYGMFTQGISDLLAGIPDEVKEAEALKNSCPPNHKWDEASQKCVSLGSAVWSTINDFGKTAPGMGLVGQAGLSMAQAPGFKPDVTLGAASGALQGYAQGGLFGALGGGLMGMLTTGRDLDAYNNAADQFQRTRILNSSVSPNLGYYAQFGGQTPGAVPSQTETGELVLFPDNTLPDVKAKLRHKQMGDEEVTDMLPENSYVFSDDKDMKFDLKAMKDKVLGYGMSYYDEHSNYPTETMRFGDIMPESGKMTFANAARVLRSKIPTMGNKKDVFDIVTDADNLETRVPYLMELINLQDAKNASEGRTESTVGPQSEEQMSAPEELPTMQAWGGMVPQYQRGGRNQDIRQSAYIKPGHPLYVQPTRQDSIALLNNSRLVDRYFKNTNNYKPYIMSDVDRDFRRRNPNSLNALLNSNPSGWGILSQLKESRRIYNPNDNRKYPTAGGGTNIGPLPMQYFYKEDPSNPFAFFQREGMNKVLDTKAPMQLFDRRIAPNKSGRYVNINESDPLQSDMIQLYEYDPVAIMPIDIMLRDAPHLIEQRRRQYGLTPGDLQYLNNSGYKAPGAATTQTPQVETPATPAEKEKVYQHWKHVNGVKVPITQEEYERDFGKAQEISRTPKIDSTKYDIVPYVKQFGGMGSILPTLMEKTYDKSIGSKFLGDKGKALIPIVTTALGVPAMRYGKKWTIIED